MSQDDTRTGQPYGTGRRGDRTRPPSSPPFAGGAPPSEPRPWRFTPCGCRGSVGLRTNRGGAHDGDQQDAGEAPHDARGRGRRLSRVLIASSACWGWVSWPWSWSGCSPAAAWGRRWSVRGRIASPRDRSGRSCSAGRCAGVRSRRPSSAIPRRPQGAGRRRDPRQRDGGAGGGPRARRRRCAARQSTCGSWTMLNPDGVAAAHAPERARRRPQPELPLALASGGPARRPAILRAAGAVRAGVAGRLPLDPGLRPRVTIWFHQPLRRRGPVRRERAPSSAASPAPSGCRCAVCPATTERRELAEHPRCAGPPRSSWSSRRAARRPGRPRATATACSRSRGTGDLRRRRSRRRNVGRQGRRRGRGRHRARPGRAALPAVHAAPRMGQAGPRGLVGSRIGGAR